MKQISRDISGATVVETALILPVFLMMMFGIFQLGMVFLGQAGMSHALGEGARMATLYPTPSDADIKNKMLEGVFRAQNFGTYSVADPVRSGDSMALKVKYVMPMKFFMVSLPDVVLEKEKIVYTTSKVS